MCDITTKAVSTKISSAPRKYYEKSACCYEKVTSLEKIENDNEIINKKEKTSGPKKAISFIKKIFSRAKNYALSRGKDASLFFCDKYLFIKNSLISYFNKAVSFSKKSVFSAREKFISLVNNYGKEVVLKFSIAFSVFTFAILVAAVSFSCGYTVRVGDKQIGVVPSTQFYDEALSELKDEILSATGMPFSLDNEPSFSPKIALKNSFASKDSLKEGIKSLSSSMLPAYAINVDGKMVVALVSKAVAEETLNDYKLSLAPNENVTSCDFSEDVCIKYQFVPKSILYNKDTAISHLLSGKFTLYTAKEDESVDSIAKKTGVSQDAILCANVVTNNTITKGQTIKLYKGEHFANVCAVIRSERKEDIPFETITEENAELYQGKTAIKTKGENGIRYVDEYITYVNGIETERHLTRENIIKEQSPEIMLVGTKPLPSPIGTGELKNPTNGELSSRFGSRWGRNHDGIDIAATIGTPIYAADNGTVTKSEFNNGGYGYLVEIDHGNGYTTHYAHCNELLVEVGQIVGKGDLIAKVGNTGRSTGAHLHFEVRKENAPTDPLSLIK